MTSFRGIITILVVGTVLLTAACQLPQWRVFQAKIDPKLAEKPATQVEAERRAAKFIEQKSAALEPDAAKQVAAIHSVAVPLSSSLGEPAKSVAPTLEDQSSVIAALRQGVLAEQKKAEQWRAFARKYAGKELEDTGVNLAGPAGLLALASIVAACIACPAFGYIVLRLLPVLWGFFTRTTAAVDEFTQSHSEAGEKLKQTLSRRMDEAHKALVRRRRKVSP